jgi:hypothetical protein
LNTNYFMALVLTIGLVVSQPALANGVVIESAASELVGDTYQLNAKLAFDFDEEVREALEHGIAFNVDITILIKRERSWLWNPKIKEETLRFRLEQYPLSNRYLITDLGNDDRRQFQSLDEALTHLSVIEDHFLISKSVLDDAEAYVGMILAEINTVTSSPVIRPVAAVSKKWRMRSAWHEWVFTKQ